jgi:2,3-bisphosphoglycerate-dependent phosphoglycerate mutase
MAIATITELKRPARATTAASAGRTLTQAFGRLFSLEGEGASELYLVRHGEPDYDATANGHAAWDPPLTDAGIEQAERLADRLSRAPVSAVYASTMRRAIDTAQPIARQLGLEVQYEDDLREITFDPQTLQAEPNEDGELARDLAERFLGVPRWDSLPGFEPSRHFRHRVIQALERIVSAHLGRSIVVVAHGGVINAYLSMILGIERDMFFLPSHSSVSTVRVRDDLYAVLRINDVAHLSPSLVSA